MIKGKKRAKVGAIMKDWIVQGRAMVRVCFLLTVAGLFLTGTVAAGGDGAFDKVLIQDGISFHVICANESSLNELKIIPAGLSRDNSSITIKEVDGIVTGAEAGDLNNDGSPEIYVYVTSVGSGSYGSLIAYAGNKNTLLSKIYLPELDRHAQYGEGYMGHDVFSLQGDRLARRFPIYRKGDVNAAPSGGTRELLYKLVPGEAGWILRPVSSRIL